MGVWLLVQGGEPVELHESESFNKVRRRLNDARKRVIDYDNGNIDGESKGQKFDPYTILSFATVNEDDEDSHGRISIGWDRVIGVVSDEPKDVGSSRDDDDDEDDD
jgi:hypothetical protein